MRTRSLLETVARPAVLAGRHGLLAVLLLSVGLACSPVDDDASSGGEVPEAADEAIVADEILADVRNLSADQMQGRATGTEGEAMAADYIEGRFREVGLEPVEGSYRQEVRLVGMRRRDDASSLRIEGPDSLELREGDNVTYWSTAQQEVVDLEAAPLLFVGYGVQAPEYDWDDFGDADVAGKVLLFLNDDPPVAEEGTELFGGDARTYYGRWTYKFEQAMAHGAAGAFMIHTTPSASYPFSVVSGSGSRESFALDLPGSGYQVPLVGWLDETLSSRIAAAMGTDLDGLFAMGASRDFEPVDTGYTVTAHVETDVRDMTTQNVLGMVPGSDPELSEQVIVFSAHYDHIGVDESLADDTIYNGAWDNASGTAGIIALAKAFGALEEAPGRSLLFLAAAAEESGSLGSAWFVANPPFERSRLVANFNIDMPQIFGVTADIAAIGVETSSLGDELREAAGRLTVTRDGTEAAVVVTGDPNPAAGSFYRSDQVNFAKAGIPALFLNPGVEYVEDLGFDPREYRDLHYHQPSDEITAEWDLAGMVRDLRIVLRAALSVADAEEMPRWAPGNEFEEEWRQLHGME